MNDDDFFNKFTGNYFSHRQIIAKAIATNIKFEQFEINVLQIKN